MWRSDGDGAAERAQPPYLRIVDAIRRRISSGELRTGDRVPSTRQITAEWGVAMATATKALTKLRHDGLVQSVPGVGTVVSPKRAAGTSARHRPRAARASESIRDRVIRAGIQIADEEGLGALSMRRVAAELGTGPMSLYRHVASKEELCQLMADTVFGTESLPEPGPDSWRGRLELVARLHWRTYQRHPWVAALVASLFEPPLMPSGMTQVEWELRGLTGLGLDHVTMLRVVITTAAYVSGVALNRELEVQAADQGTGGGREWRASNDTAVAEIFASGRFPLLAALDVDDEQRRDPDALFELGLQCHLDGVATLVERLQGS